MSSTTRPVARSTRPARLDSTGLPLPAWIAAGVLTLGVAGGALARATDPPIASVMVNGTASLKTMSGHHERWAAHEIALTFDASLDAIGPDARDAIQRAFEAWASTGIALPAVLSEPTDEAGEAKRDGVNRIMYGPITAPGHERDVAITISYVDASGKILEADTIFNSAYGFAVQDGSGADEALSCWDTYDLQNVATHEAGHLYGLGEDMDDATATMYLRSAPCELIKRAPTDPDRLAMTTLYDEPTAHGCGQAPVPSGGQDGRGAWILLAVAALVTRLRR